MKEIGTTARLGRPRATGETAITSEAPTSYDASAYEYELPEESIAQEPPPRRADARLLVLEPEGGPLDRGFAALATLLETEDLLVFNDTQVIPARVHGVRSLTGGRAEGLLMPHPSGDLRMLLGTRGRPAAGETFHFLDERLVVRLLQPLGEGVWKVASDPGAAELVDLLETAGQVPLPPYIHRAGPDDARGASDRERYQTVFARHPGAVAAPTAGLHFTPEFLAELDAAGIARARVTLHVGPGTFRPVTCDDLRRHPMHAEHYSIDTETSAAIAACRARGGRVVAVGTTVVRALEDAVAGDGDLRPTARETRLFIHPPHRFRVVDAMLTNFHAPRSTLLMLVAAFAGRERVLAAYRHAVRSGYRFLSYGDAMFLTRPAGS